MSSILNSFSLEGKVAWVTGGCYGIGYAIAKAYSQAGATVIFNARKEEHIQKALEDYKKDGITAYGYLCDVTKEEEVHKLVKEIEQKAHLHRSDELRDLQKLQRIMRTAISG